MKKGLLAILAAVLLAGCEEGTGGAPIQVEMKPPDVQQEQLQTFTYEDYRGIADRAAEKMKKLATGNELTDRWIFRTTAADELLYSTDFTDDELVKFAIYEKEKSEAWKAYAKEAYDVTASEEEVDRFIKEGPLASFRQESEASYSESDVAEYQATADALGLTAEEFSFDFQRDLYERNVIWEELKPKLREKYGSQADLHEAYNEELADNTNK
ncbi:hypothetical protein [Indiicoccus explosivorum]|uniref:hypothetical protein n=1 Tax=Indiicoccus explosivorum TaxID=1917864 RepID=UPI000B43D98B|nr:hypothetical protein [Indiicoccus explosivorum]